MTLHPGSDRALNRRERGGLPSGGIRARYEPHAFTRLMRDSVLGESSTEIYRLDQWVWIWCRLEA
jgi:hypothetical protein